VLNRIDVVGVERREDGVIGVRVCGHELPVRVFKADLS
jgi:hypothetical protein